MWKINRILQKKLSENDYLYDDGFEEGLKEIKDNLKMASEGSLSLFDVVVEMMQTVKDRSFGNVDLTLELR